MTPAIPTLDLSQAGGRALQEVLATLLSLPVSEISGEANREVGRPAIVATVALTGVRVAGEVCLHLSETFAELAADRLLGESSTAPRDAADVNDLAGELGNMVAGRVASLLGAQGFPCQLGTPVVFRGTGVRVASVPGTEHDRTGWLCDGHWLTLEIQCRHRPT